MRGRDSLRGGFTLLVKIVATIVASYVLSQFVSHQIDPTLGWVGVDLVECAVMATTSSAVLWLAVLGPLEEQHRGQDFDRQLQVALDMAPTEAAGYEVVRRAVGVAAVPGRVQLLLADSSKAHLKLAVENTDRSDVYGCPVVAPFDCPAIRRGQTTRFRSDSALDACPWLADRGQGPERGLHAVCVPLNTVGGTIGVLHVAVPAPQPIGGSAVRDLEAIADRVSTRLGTLRVMEQTLLQASTDPLTGLLNRRSVEDQLRDLMRTGQQFALAMSDLDHFKIVNDTFGHDAGDRALRVFSRSMRSALREQDVVARYGGEEFLLVFPGLGAHEAGAALERVRESLALNITVGGVPPFTASFGVADSADEDSLDDLLRAADSSLFRAKSEGRNRVVVADSGRAASSVTQGIAT